MREATDGLAELSAHQHQGVVYVVAPLVEGSCFEAVLGRPEEHFDSNRVVKDFPQELQLLRLRLVRNIRCSELPSIRGEGAAEDSRVKIWDCRIKLQDS